jgi:hypothetical protein
MRNTRQRLGYHIVTLLQARPTCLFLTIPIPTGVAYHRERTRMLARNRTDDVGALCLCIVVWAHKDVMSNSQDNSYSSDIYIQQALVSSAVAITICTNTVRNTSLRLLHFRFR